MANRVSIRIYNQTYHILAEEEESYIQKCAAILDKEMKAALDGTLLSVNVIVEDKAAEIVGISRQTKLALRIFYLKEGDLRFLYRGVSDQLIEVGSLSLHNFGSVRAAGAGVFRRKLSCHEYECNVRRSKHEGQDKKPDGNELSFI